jgi:hypothetical protein
MTNEGDPTTPSGEKVVDLTLERMKLLALQVGRELRKVEGQILTPEHAEEFLYSDSRKLAELILEKLTPIAASIPQVALDRYTAQVAGLTKDEVDARLKSDEKISEAEALALAKRALEIFPAPSSSA